MKCIAMSLVFTSTAAEQGLDVKGYPPQACLVYDFLHAMYSLTPLIPLEWLKTELQKYDLQAKKYFLTRQDPYHVIRYYVERFRQDGIADVRHFGEEDVAEAMRRLKSLRIQGPNLLLE